MQGGRSFYFVLPQEQSMSSVVNVVDWGSAP